jgi:hypothetical protein
VRGGHPSETTRRGERALFKRGRTEGIEISTEVIFTATNLKNTMDIRSFKNADIDRKNAEQTEEEYANEEGGAEALEMLLEEMRGKAELVIPTADNLDEFYNDEEQREIYQALKKKFDPDMVSAEIVEEEHPQDGTPHHYCVECDCCVGCGCCECPRSLPPSFKGACEDCGQIETECALKIVGDKVMCCDCIDPEEGGKELLVCLYCGRDENECEEQTEEEKNPITNWCGGWGMSCDDCYYEHHPEDEEKDELNSAIDASGNALY